MKILREANYRIQSINKHLKNILEEDYYIELGSVDYHVLTRLLNGEEVDINECIYDDLAAKGIGEILSNNDNSLAYQLSYLIHLRQKSSSCKIFLTCNILKYKNRLGNEIYAPIVLIPVSIDYPNGKIIASSEAIPNKLLLNELINLDDERNSKKLEITTPDRLNNIAQIDNFSVDLAKKTASEFQIGNFFTYASVEYPDFKASNDLLDIERSIYENSAEVISKEYYSKVKAILPTNIQQKYVILKAAKDESFAVDGKTSSGKTYTILNIVADKIAKGKKVLYVNQDSDAISRFERELHKHHMGAFTHNFEQIIPIDHQTEIFLPELKNETIKGIVPDELFAYEKAYNAHYHGLTYRNISERLAFLNNKYPNLELLPVENDLENYEINEVAKRLKNIENLLENIDPLKDNLWSNIEEYYDAKHEGELKQAVRDYKNAQIEFNKYFSEFCTRYEIINPDNFNDAHRLISDVRTFSLTKVPPTWSNAEVYKEAAEALEELKKDIIKRIAIEKKYEQLVTDDYRNGDSEDILDTLCYHHLNNQESKYINQLLSPFSPLETIINDLRNEQNVLKYPLGKLKEIMGMRELPKDIYSFFLKMENLLSHTGVNINWIKMFIYQRDEHQNVNATLEQLINVTQEIHAVLLQYAIRKELFKYENLKLMTNNEHFRKLISKNFDRKVMRANRKSSEKLYQITLEFMDCNSEIIKVANKHQLLGNLKIADFCEAYRGWMDFTKNLDEVEYQYLVTLVEQNDLYYLLKNTTFLSAVSEFNEHVEAIRGIFNQMLVFGIHVPGVGVLEQLSNVDEWVDYLRRVIKCKHQLYKVYVGNSNITHADIIEIIKMDRDYQDLFNKTNELSNRYYGLLGETYQGLYTNCEAISSLMEHFEAFQNKLVNRRHMTSLLSTFGFKQMVEEYAALNVLSDKVLVAHRQFSRFFKGGQPSLLECSLNKSVQIIDQYELKKQQLDDVFIILDAFKYFARRGLFDLINGIKNSKYTTLLAEKYIYSIYRKYQEQLILNNPCLANPFKLLEYFDESLENEQIYCLNNISNLISHIPNTEKRNKERRNVVTHFNDYNRKLETEARNCSVFLANVDVFNSDLILSNFNTIIIDDCHIASSNKYHRIVEGQQVLLFGNKSFRTSVANSLLNRVNPGAIVHYNRCYYPTNNLFKNEWRANNQYIYDFDIKAQVQKVASLHSMIEMIVHSYNNNQKPNYVVNIVVFSSVSRRQIYSLLLEKLLETLDSTEVLKLLSTKFNIINGEKEDAVVSDETVIFFDDYMLTEKGIQDLILRNFTCTTKSITLAYLDSKDEKVNQMRESLLTKFITTNDSEPVKATGITKLIIDKMKKKGLNATMGMGCLDIIVKNKKTANIGIMIIGSTKNDSYFLLDDYDYYYNEYIKKGWNMFVFFMDDLINNLDKRIDEVLATNISLEEKTSDNINQLSFDENNENE